MTSQTNAAGKDMDLTRLTMRQQVEGIRSRTFSATELVEAFITRIGLYEQDVSAFISYDAESARSDAALIDAEVSSGAHDERPLTGAVISLKDLFDQAGTKTTAGRQLRYSRLAETDAHVVRRLKRAGAIILGRANLHEFASGMTTGNPYYGQTRNPWAFDHIPGGSSGGSAAAVAARFCSASIGSDTGGSVRLPAALCGVVGVKPTYGRIGRSGMVPLSRSVDVVGILARCVDDAALLLQVLSGFDELDPDCSDRAVPDFADQAQALTHGRRVGIPTNYFNDRLSEDAAERHQAAVEVLVEHGWEPVEVDIPSLDKAADAQAVIGRVDTAIDWPDLPSDADSLGDDVRQRLIGGHEISAVDYVRALRDRETLRREFEEIFRECDVLACPPSATSALPIGAERATIRGRALSLAEIYAHFTGTFSLVGLPAVVSPTGLDRLGLPLGIQLVASWYGEGKALAAARAVESAFPLMDPELERHSRPA